MLDQHLPEFPMPRRSSSPSPADFATLGLTISALWTEAAMVMGMRFMGMAGMWAVRPDETARMVAEKGPAFSDAALAGMSAAWAGKRPDQVAAAAMAPLTRAARANRRRLAKAGPGPRKG
jgi:hypothetical protein